MENLELNDFVRHQGKIYKVLAIGKSRVRLECGDVGEVEPIEITPFILKCNGWIEKANYCVFKHKDIRLGWSNGTFLIGYGTLPQKIKWIHELQHI